MTVVDRSAHGPDDGRRGSWWQRKEGQTLPAGINIGLRNYGSKTECCIHSQRGSCWGCFYSRILYSPERPDLLILTFPCLPSTALWAGWRRAAVPRAKSRDIGLVSTLLGAHGLRPKTELFKTNDNNFHCWTLVIGR